MHEIKYLFLLLSMLCFPLYASEYNPWSENVFIYVKDKYGLEAERRMRFLNKLIIENKNKTDMEKLVLVNNTINLFPWISDRDKWKKDDYWETPLEMVTTFGGDCEDMTFTKWLLLRHLGIKKHQLYFAYVKTKATNQSHMVLVYNPAPNIPIGKTQVYVLDNMDPEVKLGSKRQDLEGIYLIDPSGEILLLSNDGKKREVIKIINAANFKKFAELKAHFFKDREFFKKLNDGQYLLPDL